MALRTPPIHPPDGGGQHSPPLEVVREPPPDYDDSSIPVEYSNTQPSDLEAALLGALLLHPHLAPAVKTQLTEADFAKPTHGATWDAIHTAVDGGCTDPKLIIGPVVAELTKTYPGGRKRGLTPTYLTELITAAGEPLHLEQYATEIRNTARLRNTAAALRQALQIVTSATPDNTDQALAEVSEIADHEATRFEGIRTNLREHVETIDELLAGGEQDDDEAWVIHGLLERQDRLIITAAEGAGKSTMLRQIAVTAAAGLHPFTQWATTPIRVLHIDVENSRRQSRRRYRPLRIKAGTSLDPNRLLIKIRLQGLDLTTREDADWLLSTCQATRPDLLLIGPIYKLANGDPTEEKSAKPVAMTLDRIRDETDCAIILEGHAAKANGSSAKRPHEPYGWSGWMRWPEFGLWLDKDGSLIPWRGGREERQWPTTLTRGGEWPWTPTTDETAIRWARIQTLRTVENKHLTFSDLETVTGYSRGTLARIIGKNAPYADAWTELNGPNDLFTEDEDTK